MIEKDRELIRIGIVADDWNEIEELIKQAKSSEAKRILNDRKVHLYRKEEQFADQL